VLVAAVVELVVMEEEETFLPIITAAQFLL